MGRKYVGTYLGSYCIEIFVYALKRLLFKTNPRFFIVYILCFMVLIIKKISFTRAGGSFVVNTSRFYLWRQKINHSDAAWILNILMFREGWRRYVLPVIWTLWFLRSSVMLDFAFEFTTFQHFYSIWIFTKPHFENKQNCYYKWIAHYGTKSIRFPITKQ